jgi:Ca2+-dependent lipid-binding protein
VHSAPSGGVRHRSPAGLLSSEHLLTSFAHQEFLNDIVAQLWPNINVAGSQLTKDIADPMFKTMLPGPLASLHFTKVDLGTVPMRLSNVLATKTDTGSIKLDMNVDWDGQCDIQLDGDMIPSLVSR